MGDTVSDFFRLASTRRSIRRFTDQDVNLQEVIECVQAGTTAPSGCNSQCWEFVVIHKRETINDIAKIVEQKQIEFFEKINMAYDKNYLDSRIKMLTFFKKAPVCIAVFMTELPYYDKTYETALYEFGYTYKEAMELFGNPDILSIGAAIQNILLALHEKGYGACWMNDPIIAKEEIAEYLNMMANRTLISLVPVGIPTYVPKEKKYKDPNEVIHIIE